MKKIVEQEIERRSQNAKELSKRFSDLKGLSWKEFLMKLPIKLDFITAHELWEDINKQEKDDQRTNT